MGSKKDKAKAYMSKEGRADRSIGMKKESKNRQWCYCAMFCCSSLIVLIFGALYAARSSNSMKIEGDYGIEGIDALVYDSCLNPIASGNSSALNGLDGLSGGDMGLDLSGFADIMNSVAGLSNAMSSSSSPGYVVDPDVNVADQMNVDMEKMKFCMENMDNCKKGTQWTSTFTFNSIVLIIMALNYITMAIGGFYLFPRIIGTICNCCCGCCHFAAFITVLSVRFGPLGQWCANNVVAVQYEGDGKFNDSWTYKKDASLLATLGAIQLIFWCVQCYCCWLPLFMTPEGGSSHNETPQVMNVSDDGHKKDKKKKKKHSSGSSS